MIKFVYFDLGGVIIKDFSATNKWQGLLRQFKINEEFWDQHYGEIDTGRLPTDVSINYTILLEAFVSRFERVEGIKKSDPRLFEIAQKRSGVDKSEILYVENSAEKIEVAQKFGWKTFFFDSSDYEASCKKLMKIVEQTSLRIIKRLN